MHLTQILDPTAKLRVVIHNHQRLLGDRLLMTPLIRDLRATYPNWRLVVDVENDIAWRNNPHAEQIVTPGRSIEGKVDFTAHVGPMKATQGSRANGLHITRAFAQSFILQSGLPVHDGPFKCDLHLSAAEQAWQPVSGPCWVINCDTANMGAKRWVTERWRDLVRLLPHITFVQVGLPQDTRIDLSDEPNVIGLVGQTDERQLMALVAGATGCVSLVSSLQHIAAAFDKPCVVLAGGREPRSFCAYPAQHHIDRLGMLDCCRDRSCWKNSIEACVDREMFHPESGKVVKTDIPRCMRMIATEEVAAGVRGFYQGGRLVADTVDTAMLDTKAFAAAPRRRLLRIVSNGKFLGGAERSVAHIARLFDERDWSVEIATRQPICAEMQAAMPAATATGDVSSPCDVLLFYASDMVFDVHKPEFASLAAARAERRVMALTYKLGKAPTEPWCQGWDRYLFLCSTLRDEFIKQSVDLPKTTKVLAPPVELAPFLAAKPNYEGSVRVVRWSSQGDKKWPDSTAAMLAGCPEAQFYFMPGPANLPRDSPAPNLTGVAYGQMPPDQVAALGNLFVYLLPDGYSDQGPRVIVEAMAAGLPVMADRRWGAKDRVTMETGWLIDDHSQAIEIINHLTPELLAAKGVAARQRAQSEFDPQRWVEAIIGGN